MILKLGGGTILYKSKYQDTIALSSTEAEFVVACKLDKSILYVWSILNEINISQQEATILYIDNNGAMLMGNAQQPTCQTKHVDIKKFALLDWIEHNLMTMQQVKTTDNSADAMTKSLGIMGYIIKPNYNNKNTAANNRQNDHTNLSSKYVFNK